MLNWLRSLAAVISGKTRDPDPLDAPAIDADSRDSDDLIEPRAQASSVEPLEELERLLREPFRSP
jgi:hypothetical protein